MAEFPQDWYMWRPPGTQPYRRPTLQAIEPVPASDEGGCRNLALLPEAVASASGALPGFPIHQVAHLNDGWYGNDASWIEGGRPSWAQVDLGAVHTISRVCVGNDHTQRFKDRGATAFRVLAASDALDSPALQWQTRFGPAASDNLLACLGNADGLPRLAVGRFPVRTLSERCAAGLRRGGSGPTHRSHGSRQPSDRGAGQVRA